MARKIYKCLCGRCVAVDPYRSYKICSVCKLPPIFRTVISNSLFCGSVMIDPITINIRQNVAGESDKKLKTHMPHIKNEESILDISAKYRSEINRLNGIIRDLCACINDDMSIYDLIDGMEKNRRKEIYKVYSEIEICLPKMARKCLEYSNEIRSAMLNDAYIADFQMENSNIEFYTNYVLKLTNSIPDINYKYNKKIIDRLRNLKIVKTVESLLDMRCKYGEIIKKDTVRFSRYIESIYHTIVIEDAGWYGVLLKEALSITGKEDAYLKKICPAYEGRDIYVKKANVIRHNADKIEDDPIYVSIDGCTSNKYRKWPFIDIDSDDIRINNMTYKNYIEKLIRCSGSIESL